MCVKSVIRTIERSFVLYSAQDWACAMCGTRETPKKRYKGSLCNICGKKKRTAELQDEDAADSLLGLSAQ